MLLSLGLLGIAACSAGNSKAVASSIRPQVRECHPLPEVDSAIETLATATTFSTRVGWGLVPSDTFLAFLKVFAQRDAASQFESVCNDPRSTPVGYLYSSCGLILLDPSLETGCHVRPEWLHQDVQFMRGCIVSTSLFSEAYTQMDALANELLRGQWEYLREHSWPPNNSLQRMRLAPHPLND